MGSRGKTNPIAGGSEHSVPSLLNTMMLVLLIHLSLTVLMFTPTTGETINNGRKLLVRELLDKDGEVCVKPLEGGGGVEATLRLEVKPITWGTKLHLAGSVHVPNSHFPASQWSMLRYHNSMQDKNLVLKVEVNQQHLVYEPFQDMYSGRFRFNAVKIYMKGEAEVIFNCSDALPKPLLPKNTTEPTATTATITTTATLVTRPTAPITTTSTTATTTTTITSNSTATGTTTSTSSDDTINAANYMIQPVAQLISYDETSAAAEAAAAPSGIHMMGAAGSVPILLIVLLVAGLMVAVVILSAFIAYRRRTRSSSPRRMKATIVSQPPDLSGQSLIESPSHQPQAAAALPTSINGKTNQKPLYTKLAHSNLPDTAY